MIKLFENEETLLWNLFNGEAQKLECSWNFIISFWIQIKPFGKIGSIEFLTLPNIKSNVKMKHCHELPDLKLLAHLHTQRTDFINSRFNLFPFTFPLLWWKFMRVNKILNAFLNADSNFGQRWNINSVNSYPRRRSSIFLDLLWVAFVFFRVKNGFE